MKLYKLTDENDQTKNNTQWGKSVVHSTSGEGDLCGPGWLHAYTDPLLAVLLNPIHANFDESTMHLWLCEGEVGKREYDLKVGCKRLMTIRRMKLPKVTLLQRCRFAILAAKEVYTDKQFNKWASEWLSGKDRTKAAARSAESAAWAAEAAAWAAAWAAEAAAWAAEAAAWAAWAAAWAAWAAEAATRSAEVGNKKLDLAAIARKACKR